ncbi:MAG: hypothetical protein KatS3mg096_579 [Candidatus Parcubacteria bacterium]|nr:MAG: hypothetical protein KatS3mg096_579 [Candidatus Parcubacteria bacterium]
MRKKYHIGGYITGKSHKEGGVIIEVEGGEAIINKYSVNKDDVLMCKGKPKDILSSINTMWGTGVSFGKDDACKIDYSSENYSKDSLN